MEQVDHPDHYTQGDIEPIDVIKDWELDFHLGSVVKYVARCGKKKESTKKEDLEKARWLLEDKLEDMEDAS